MGNGGNRPVRRSLLGHLRLVIVPYKAEEKEALDTHGPFDVIEEVISQLGYLSGAPEDR